MSSGNIFRGRLVTADAVIEDGVIEFDRHISFLGSADEYSGDIGRATRVAGYILPGLVDVHCHGGGGASFPEAKTREDVLTAIMEHRRHGTTSLVGSCVTDTPEVLKQRASLMADLCEAGELDGIHYEGPFVSKDRCGAQDPRYIIDPDPELTQELLDAGRGFVKTMTIAPEKDNITGPGGVSEVLIKGGALPSFGHTDAGPEKTREALEDAGNILASTSPYGNRRATVTHLFNGMRPLHHRDPGPISEFLSDASRGGAIVEMIGDGVHLDFHVIRDVYEILGRENIVFVTDAMAAAGMADGDYVLGPQAVTVKDGVARLTGASSIAGGTSHLLDQVKLLTEFGLPLVDVVYACSQQGAFILNDDSIGSLGVGKLGNLVITTPDLECVSVYRNGSQVV